jgi:glycosyltransferase involved in cell wall biosynthesis
MALTRTGPGVRILGLSDVAVGYGSPQVQHLLKSLGDHYDAEAILMLEPDQKRRGVRPPIYPDIDVARIVTMFPPYDERFLIEFNLEARRVIDEFRPDVVVATHGWVLPAALTAARRPQTFIYYMLESLSHQEAGIGEWAIELNRQALLSADLVLAPERRRAAADLRLRNWKLDGVVEVLNCAPAERTPQVSPEGRLSRILYTGSIGPQTLSHFLDDERLADVPFDIAGPAESNASQALLDRLVQRPNITYLGVLTAEEVAQLRARYAYSLVMWNPDSINQLYASPNKFFEAIQSGVPPVSAPHPQCADILARYGCGLVMMDWSPHIFGWTVREALRIFREDKPAYARMVEGCRTASEREINWQAQFEKIAARLPSRRALLAAAAR